MGFVTCTLYAPAAVIFSDTRNWVALTKVTWLPVKLCDPTVTFNAVPLVKLAPLMVSVWVALDAVSGFGVSEVMEGGGATTWSVTEFDATPAALTAWNAKLPGDEAITLTVILVAVSEVN